MPTEELFIGATSYTEVFALAQSRNLDNATTNRLIEGLLQQSRGKTKRTFAYAATLVATEADCRPTATRSFAHIDWIDGESVVQAEETSLEEGFNQRFHKIEDDIDASNVDVAKLFECLAELRRDVAARLEEIRLELNRVNTDIAECCNDDSGPVVTWPGYDPGIYYPVDPYPGYGGYGGWRLPGTTVPGGGWGGGGGVGPMPDPRGPYINPGYGGYSGGGFSGGGFMMPKIYPQEYVQPWKSKAPFETGGPNIVRSSTDDNVAIIAGLQGRRIGNDMFNGKAVDIWSTPAGVIMTPGTEPTRKGAKVGWTNPHIEGAGTFLGWAHENSERIGEAFRGKPFTVRELEEGFGDDRLPNGIEVGAFLQQLPSGATVKNSVDVAHMVIDRATANVRRDQSVDETVIGLVGLNAGKEAPGSVSVSAVSAISAGAAAGLAKIGITTLSELAAADPVEVSGKLKEVRIDAPIEETAAWNAAALALGGLMRPL